jgi:hypothetical protein
MTDIITQIMVEVLKIFGIATKELRRGSASELSDYCLGIVTELRIEKFLRKLAGMAELEDALKRLDRLTQEEARMALAEVLRITHSIRDEVEVVDGKVERVEDKVEVIDGKVQVVIDGARGVYSQSPILSNMYTLRKQAGKRGGERSKIDYSTVGERHSRNQVFVTSPLIRGSR